MSFKRALTITFSLLTVILLGLVAAMKMLSNASKDLTDAELLRYESLEMVHRFQQISANLTRMAQSYVVTGDPFYKQRYHQMLAIRYGTIREPLLYEQTSWSWTRNNDLDRPRPGPPITFEERLQRAQCTKEELATLHRGKDIVSTIFQMELSAIDAVDKAKADPDYTIDGTPAKQWSQQLLFGEEYALSKRDALSTLDTFFQSVEERTEKGVAAARSHQQTLQLITWLLVLLSVATSIAAYLQITRRVVHPLSALSEQAKKVSHGDYSEFPEPSTYTEIKSLASTFNHMASSIEQDLKRRDIDHKELIAAKHAVEVAYGRIKKDLKAAAKIQRSLLPEVMPEAPGFEFAYSYLPCEELAGDTLNVLELDDDHIALYLVDVSGHGVQAALLAATLSHLLSPIRHESSVIWSTDHATNRTYVTPPTRVAEQLNTLFPYDPALNQYFTLHYGILNKKDLTYRFVSCGHPKPVLLRSNQPPQIIQAKGPGIGLLPTPAFEEIEVQLTANDRIFFFSDGVLEAPNNQGVEFQDNGLYSHIKKHLDLPIQQHIQYIFKDVLEWSGGKKLDDISAVAIEVRPEVN